MKNKKIWWFLFRFFGTYFLLFFMYSVFLKFTETKEPFFASDPITEHVAKSTRGVLNLFQESSHIEQHPNELSFKLFIGDDYVSRIIEGCNSMSVIVLFAAFVIAFKGKWKQTLLFVFLGSISIYWINIVRIALLSYGISNFKEFEDILHDLIFPATIYGYVFLLWVVWVNRFSSLKKAKR